MSSPDPNKRPKLEPPPPQATSPSAQADVAAPAACARHAPPHPITHISPPDSRAPSSPFTATSSLAFPPLTPPSQNPFAALVAPAVPPAASTTAAHDHKPSSAAASAAVFAAPLPRTPSSSASAAVQQPAVCAAESSDANVDDSTDCEAYIDPNEPRHIDSFIEESRWHATRLACHTSHLTPHPRQS
jgi:hypothetical protein